MSTSLASSSTALVSMTNSPDETRSPSPNQILPPLPSLPRTQAHEVNWTRLNSDEIEQTRMKSTTREEYSTDTAAQIDQTGHYPDQQATYLHPPPPRLFKYSDSIDSNRSNKLTQFNNESNNIPSLQQTDRRSHYDNTSDIRGTLQDESVGLVSLPREKNPFN